MDSLLVVIVLYKCTLFQSKSYNSITKGQIDCINCKINFFIYDNTPLLTVNDSFELGNRVVEYVCDPMNSGLSIAYNKACEFARIHNYDYLLLLDQDTELSENFLLHICECAKLQRNIEIFVPSVYVKELGKYISPGPVRWKRIIPIKNNYVGEVSLKRISAINSGLLITVNAFMQCGGYNPHVFLDFSDTTFFERLRKKYQKMYVIPITIYQNFSGIVKDRELQLSRFSSYCQCARAAGKNGIWNCVQYFVLICVRSILLSFRFKSFSFINVMLKK